LYFLPFLGENKYGLKLADIIKHFYNKPWPKVKNFMTFDAIL